MDDEDCSANAADKDEDEALSVAKSLAGVRLADAPILLLVYFHKSLRAELAAIRRLAVEALNHCSHDLLTELHRRIEFLKLVYKYHCTTEDEVVFLTLDKRVKNVSGSYSLEHECIDGLFDTVFDRLNVLLERNENTLKPFQELVFCIGTMQSFICQHMLKEEEQVYASLIREFSSKEQASLVCQFLCSVPVMLLELFLPWMVSFLSKDEQVDVTRCIKEIVPEENSLQEVVISWLHCGSQPLAYANVGERVQQLNGSENTSILKSLTFKRSFEENQQQKETYQLQISNDALRLWHRAIWKDLGAIRKNLYEIKNRANFPDLDSIVIQLKFLVDVLSFYSAALEKYYYSVLDELSSRCQSSLKEHFFTGSLQQLMNQHLQNGLPLCKFVEKLLQELESFLMDIRKQFATQESQVFTIFGRECSHEMQQQLLHVTLYMMPLGLLKCVITWFSSHLSEDESMFIIHGFDKRDSFFNKSFVFLLNEWFRMGYSGKTSVENFRMQLEKMFMSRCSFLSEQIKESVESSYLNPNMQDKGAIQQKLNLISTNSNSDCFPHSSSSNSYIAKNYEASYSSGILRHVYFPKKLTTLHPLPKISLEKSFTTYIKDEPVPVDLLFFFHKALKKDLEYLVFGSAQLAENASFLEDFYRHFHLMQLLFQIHSDAEDEIAFPALEARGKLQNISHSYTIDHKFEGEQFKKISCFLDEMLELQVSVSSTDAYIREQRYHQLSLRLHDVCRSVHQMLLEHVRREETELWPLFRECFSVEEQENIVKSMLGRIRAETLQHMIPWLMASLTPEEQHITMSLWRNATKNTNFDDWLAEWWEGYDIGKVVETSNISSLVSDPGEIISTYLPNDVLNEQKGESLCSKGIDFPQTKCDGTNMESLDGYDVGHKEKDFDEEWNGDDCLECSKHFNGDKERWNEVADVMSLVDKPGLSLEIQKNESTQVTGAENLVAAIGRVSHDTSLDFHKKPHIIQNLLMSHWITREQNTHSQVLTSSKGNDISGQHPSYRDPLKPIFGCKHYKRNCKILAACCNQLYTCIRCHDEVVGQEHSVDRKSITQMMCMKCLIIQPIGSTCSTLACKNLSMARYYCSICKLFDDEREIYHCPYCNLCRVGKGLGIDYFHCMNCNACMSRSLSVHVCREKCFMDNCPICHEDIFTSSSPVKALRCGHLMHSTCFQDYTCTHYTCPLCSKSLGDMQVYFEMLDALLAEEKIPQEYSDQTQAILCNDCEKRGTAPFHWLYHKCSFCGSYNTRLL